MEPFVVRDSGFELLLWRPGRQPAVVNCLKGSGHLRVVLLPRVAPLGGEGLGEAETAQALELVTTHRDALLTAWMTAPEPPAAEPRASRAAVDAGQQALTLQLASGAVLRVPLARLGLAGAAEDLEGVEVVCGGEALRWPRLGRYWPVADLVAAATAGGPAPAANKIRSLLGLVLVRENYMTQAQVHQVAQEQMRLKREGQQVPFGQLAVHMGFLKPEQLQLAIHLQDRLAQAPEEARPIGFMLLESATVLPSQLLTALDEQHATAKPLGRILVERGWIAESMLETFLARQSAERQPAAAPSKPAPVKAPSGAVAVMEPSAEPQAAPATKVKSLLGIILERENYMTQAQVREAIAQQEKARQGGKSATFGEVALKMGFISVEQLKFAVQLQTKLAYTPGKPKPLGFFLIENGVVKPSLIQKALEDQQRTGKRLGELLIEQGLVSESILDVFLKMQQSQPAG